VLVFSVGVSVNDLLVLCVTVNRWLLRLCHSTRITSTLPTHYPRWTWSPLPTSLPVRI